MPRITSRSNPSVSILTSAISSGINPDRCSPEIVLTATGTELVKGISGGMECATRLLSSVVSWYHLASDRSVARCSNASPCLLYTSDAADEEDSVDLGGRRI